MFFLLILLPYSLDQAFDLLVQLCLICYHTYTRCLHKFIIIIKTTFFQITVSSSPPINTKKLPAANAARSFRLCRQRSTFPGSHPPSIIDAKELNFCVRHGNRCTLFAFITDSFMYNSRHTLKTEQYLSYLPVLFPIFFTSILSWSSPRLISTALLNMLPHLHTLPIYHVVFVESYYLSVWEILS